MNSHLHAPPPPGNIRIDLPLKPVSLQSKLDAKTELKNAVRSAIRHADFFLSGEVEVEIAWYLHPRTRYEGMHSPDVDNILKPLIDALCGTEGLLVNDCQVQSVRCSWIDRLADQESLEVNLRYSPDDWIRKANLVWVEIEDKLCMLLDRSTPKDAQRIMVSAWVRMFGVRKALSESTGNWEDGTSMMPVQMPFHRFRLQEFDVIEIGELLSDFDSFG